MRKKKRTFNPKTAMVSSSLYAVKAAAPKKRNGAAARIAAIEAKESITAMEKAKQMAAIEAYAKEHKVSIAQAMIHFMS